MTNVEYFKLVGRQAEPDLGIVELYLEVGPDRIVRREIGLDADSRVVHRVPSAMHRYGDRGFWDLTPVPEGEFAPVSKELIEELWAQPALLPPPDLAPRLGFKQRFRNLIRGR